MFWIAFQTILINVRRTLIETIEISSLICINGVDVEIMSRR